MAKSAFDENVPRVRPRLRLGRSAEVDTTTETPPVRPEEAPADPAETIEPVTPSVAATEAEAAAPIVVEPAPRTALRELVSPPAAEVQSDPVAEIPSPPVAPPAAPVAQRPVETPEPAAPPAPVAEAPAPQAPAAVPPLTAAASPFGREDAHDRRASLRRRAVSVGGVAAPPPEAPAPVSALDEFDAIDAAADLAGELERALSQAAEANEQLRRDLGLALDDLARTTAENKRIQERLERLEADARERSAVVQDLLQEMELIEGERDTALTQSSEAALAVDDLNQKLILAERRAQDAERGLADAQAKSRRFEEQLQLHLAQRAALRAEVEGLRRERDGMVTRIAELEREHAELSRSRQALDEVHRALSEARQRAQRIRTR